MPVFTAKYEETYRAYLETEKEADELRRRVKILREENERLKKRVDAFVEQGIKDGRIKEKMQQIEAENEKLRRNNDHLYELHVNRSNAERNIKPKKEHSGYLVKWQGQSYSRRFGNCFKMTIETPYSAELSYEEVRKKVEAFISGLYNKAGVDIKLSCNYASGYWTCDVWSRKFADISFVNKIHEGKCDKE